MTTPEQGSLVLHDDNTGMDYAYSLYSSDVTGAFATIDKNLLAGTGSNLFILSPGNCSLKFLSIHTGQTVSSVWRIMVNDAIVGTVTYQQILDTLTNPIVPNIKIAKGSKFQLLQG